MIRLLNRFHLISAQTHPALATEQKQAGAERSGTRAKKKTSCVWTSFTKLRDISFAVVLLLHEYDCNHCE